MSWLLRDDDYMGANVRGNTFVIHACGRALDAQGKVISQTYAEAVTDAQLHRLRQSARRRMEIISFRWLSPTRNLNDTKGRPRHKTDCSKAKRTSP